MAVPQYIVDLKVDVARVEGKLDTFIGQMKAADDRFIEQKRSVDDRMAKHEGQLQKVVNKQYWLGGVGAGVGTVVGSVIGFFGRH